jgi:hypothetical protein
MSSLFPEKVEGYIEQGRRVKGVKVAFRLWRIMEE